MVADDLSVPLNGVRMHLRASELAALAGGLADIYTPSDGNLRPLVDALRTLPPNERAPLWEVAMRHFGRRTPLARAAGEIGMDVLRARTLVKSFCQSLGAVPPPDR